MKRRYMSKVVLYFTYYSIVSARQRDDGDFTGDLSKLSVPQCFPAPLLCFRWTAMLPAWHAVARILLQPQKNCFNGRRNTVLVATVVLPPLFHCFAVSAAGWLHRWMHRRSFPSMEVASAISTIANYCNRQYCKVLQRLQLLQPPVFVMNLHIIRIQKIVRNENQTHQQ